MRHSEGIPHLAIPTSTRFLGSKVDFGRAAAGYRYDRVPKNLASRCHDTARSVEVWCCRQRQHGPRGAVLAAAGAVSVVAPGAVLPHCI